MTALSYAAMMPKRPATPRIPTPEQFKAMPKDIGSAHAQQCRIFLNYFYRYDTPKRSELERQWNRARMFDAAKQWLQPVRGSAMGARLWYAWEPIRMSRAQQLYPKPVYNIFSQSVQDETARLVKVGSKAYIRCDDPEKEDGAKLSKQLLDHRNRTNNWSRQQRMGAYHAGMFGQWIEVSRWQRNRATMTRLPAPDAVSCPGGCVGEEGDAFPLSLADPTVPAQVGEQMRQRFGPEAAPMVAPDGTSLANVCPECGQELVEAALPRSSYQDGAQPKDYLGRELTQDIPFAEDVTEVKSPYSCFPGNQGIGYSTSKEMEEIAFRDARSIPFIQERFENSSDLQPEFEQAVYAHHPAVSGLWGMLSTGYGDGLWGNYRMLDEYVMKPCVEYPRGMYIAMTGQRLLQHSELMIPGTDIPLVHVEWAQWELRENEIWGKSLAEDLFLVQTTLNATLGQVLDIQQKHTTPKVILQEGQHLDFAGGANSPYAGDIWTINSRGLSAEIQRKDPFIFGHQGNVQNAFELVDRLLKQVENITGARASEIGNVSGVELNYSALLFAAQKSAERRGPRVAGFRDLMIGIWTHTLRLCSSRYLRSDKRTMMFQDDRQRWKVREIDGFALQGQSDVTIEAEPYVDDGIAKRASIEQGLKWGTVRTSQTGGDFFADRDINRAIGIPEDLNKERNAHLEHARDEFEMFFAQEAIEPMMDMYGDDHQIHWSANGLDLAGRKAERQRELAAEIGGPAYRWANVIRWTWEWERLHAQLQQDQLMMRQMPGGDARGMTQEMQRLGAPPEEIQQAAQQAQQRAQALQGFPDALELQIYECWLRLLGVAQEQSGIILQSQAGQVLLRLIRFKSHALAHWKILQMQMAQAAAAAAPPPAGAPQQGASPGAEANPLVPAAAPPNSLDAAAAA